MKLYKKMSKTETAEPDIKPSPVKPKKKPLPKEWEIEEPKIRPTPKG